MENPEEVLQLLERFTKLKQKEIPRELDDYLGFVARTGDTVYRWAIVKHLFREKLVHVITDFHDNTPSIADLPQCPNVDPFNYERMKRILLERLDAFNSAPFTVQRICELLTEPRKQYTRIDKFMRAVEKNILVVSTQEPGRRRSDSENGDSLDSIVNGDLEVNVDIEMDNEAAAFGGIDAEVATTTAAVAAESSVAAVAATGQEEESVAAAAAAAVERSVAEPVEVAKEDAAEVGGDVAEVSAAAAAVESASTVDKEDQVKEQGLGEEPVTATPSTDNVPVAEAELLKEDPKPTEEDNTEPTDEQLAIVPQPIEESPSTVEDLPVPEQQISALEPSTEPSTATTEPPSKESHELLLAQDQDQPDAATSAAIDSKAAVEPADDGQPAPKQAKLSEEAQEVPEVPAAAAIPESLETAEKDDLSSSSTTDSGGSSSTSVESEPTQVSLETAAVAVQEEQQPAGVESLPEETTTTALTVGSDEVAATPEIPAVEPELLIPEEVKEMAPVEESVAAGVLEMETAAVVVAPSVPVLIPESVMATDEEDTIIQSPVDAPMVADVPEVVKPDDNAMDVDESSVEPMEDQ